MNIDINNKRFYNMSTVLIGHFSPLAFQPHWLLKNEVLTQAEYDSIEQNNAEKCIISNTITTFETTNLIFSIENNKMQIICKTEPFDLGVDALEKLFEMLGSIQIKAYGLNYSFHFSLENAENMSIIGKKLAPRIYWEKLFDDNKDSEGKTSGLTTIIMKKIEDFGCINVRLETSKREQNSLFFSFNFHTDNESETSSAIIKNIKNSYRTYEKKTNDIIIDLLEKTLNIED